MGLGYKRSEMPSSSKGPRPSGFRRRLLTAATRGAYLRTGFRHRDTTSKCRDHRLGPVAEVRSDGQTQHLAVDGLGNREAAGLVTEAALSRLQVRRRRGGNARIDPVP